LSFSTISGSVLGGPGIFCDICKAIGGVELNHHNLTLPPGFDHFRRNSKNGGVVADRAIEARLVERGFRIVPLGEGFLKAWRQAQRDGNLVAATASWYNNQAIRGEEGVGIGAPG
jgi:hypothetical protein